jgi:hypothetical protein
MAEEEHPPVEVDQGAFNGNFEKWFAKDEPKHRIQLDPEIDIRGPNSRERKKRDLSKPQPP